MKFSMFFIAEYAHVVTQSALLATLFLGGWDIPFWSGDDAFRYNGMLIRGFAADGSPIPADPAWWKTLLTLVSFLLKTTFFVVLYIWVRWTLPRFRYDQVMSLGWKVMLPTSLTYVVVIAGTVLVLDTVGVPFGIGYGALLALVSLVCTGIFVFVLDRGRIITGAAATEPGKKRRIPVEPRVPVPEGRRQIPAETLGD
jgi:NADH-quinone oxidoreductase subunit H